MLAAMRLLRLLPFLWLLTAAAAPAEEVLSPAKFRAYAEGYTLYFSSDGEPFGSEAYRPGGETLWRFKDGTCQPGVWRPLGARICFYYGPDTEVLCWRFLRDEEGLLVRLLDSEDAGLELRITGRDKREPLCAGPAQPVGAEMPPPGGAAGGDPGGG